MGNGFHEILEMEGIKPKKALAPSLKDFEYTQKTSYAEKYQSDILPRIAKDNKKSKLTQQKEKIQKNSEYVNSLIPFKKAIDALAKTKIIHDGQKLSALDLLKEKCVYELIKKAKKDMNYDPNHALVVRWVEFYLLSVIGEIDSLIELVIPTAEPDSTELDK